MKSIDRVAVVRNQPSFFIDPNAFIASTIHMTSEEVGKLVFSLIDLAKKGDANSLLSYRFITRVLKGTAKRTHLSLDLRRKVLSVGFCASCGSENDLTVDHIIPYSKGGPHEESNLQCLCGTCNRKKGDKL